MTKIHLHENQNWFLYHHPQKPGRSEFDVPFTLAQLPTFSPKTQELVIKILEERFNPPRHEPNESDQAAVSRTLEERSILAIARLKSEGEYKSFDQLRKDAANLQNVGEPSLLKIVAASTLQTVVLSSAALFAVFLPKDFNHPARNDIATAIAVVNATEILRASWQGYKASSMTFEHYASKMEETLDKESSFLEHNSPYLIKRIQHLIANINSTQKVDSLHAETSSDVDNCIRAKVEIINALNFHRKLQDRNPITFEEAVEHGMWVEETLATKNDRVVDGELKQDANLPAYGDANWGCAIL